MAELTIGNDRAEAAKRRREALLAEYGEVANTFRLLTDIRFKLLAFLPVAAAATAALRGGGKADAATAVTTLGLSLFGMLVTAGLVSYNARNDQLYDELVGRAANIERSIGLPDGAFANRPTSWLSIRLPFGRAWPVNHRSSVAVIYAASVGLWLLMSFYSIAQLVYAGREPDWRVVAGVLLLAIVTTFGAALRIGKQRRARAHAVRTAAELAVDLAKSEGFKTAAASKRFCTLCAGLRDKDVAASRAFRDLVNQPALKWSPRQSRVHSVVTRVGKQATYYANETDPDLRRHYGLEPLEASPSPESYFVALITDLPPRWIEDVATKRR